MAEVEVVGGDSGDSSTAVLLAAALDDKAEVERRVRQLTTQVRLLDQRARDEAAAYEARLRDSRQRDAQLQRTQLMLDSLRRQSTEDRARAEAELRSVRREVERLGGELREERRHRADGEIAHARLTRAYEDLRAHLDDELKAKARLRSQDGERRELASARAALASLQRQADDAARRHQRETAESRRLLEESRERGTALFVRSLPSPSLMNECCLLPIRHS